MRVIQGRLHADNPEDAAVKLRELYGDGMLSLKRVFPEWNWFEFTIVIEGGPGKCARAKQTQQITQ